MFFWLSKIRIPVMIVAVIAVIIRVLVYRVHPRDPFDWQDYASMAGNATLVLGLLLRSWAASVIHKKEELATSGPYSLCRHPLYAGSSLMVIGFTILLGDTISAAILIPVVIATLLIAIVTEEQILTKKFGTSWEEYCKTTPMFLPFSLPGGWGAVSLDQWWVNREYEAVAASLVGVLGVLGWHVWTN